MKFWVEDLRSKDEVELKKNILTLLDLSAEDFEAIFERAIELKKRYRNGIRDKSLVGKTLGLIFDKPSIRTRVSFEAAMVQLGGTPIFIGAEDPQIARNEPVRDIARVLSNYLDGLAIRTYSQDLLDEFAEFSSIPVINALTDLYHPCQVISDIMTVIEHKGRYKDINIVWVGDGNNVSHSWINAAAVLGMNLNMACPEGYSPDRQILETALGKGVGKIVVTSDPVEAVKGADVIYTDIWASMGQESELSSRRHVFEPFQINEALLKNAPDDVILMHCLPTQFR